MKLFTGLLFIYTFANITGVVHGQSECGRVGTDADELSASKGQGFYLNTQDPAQCTGTVTQFQYCYYRSELGTAASHDFTFAVYRSMDSSYVPVSQAFTTGRTVFNANLQGGNFACVSYSVDEITVQAGDVIGVCIYDPPDNADPLQIFFRDYTNRVQLDVVGENAPPDRFLLSTGNSGCGDNSVPASVSSLGTQTSRVLHIYADITLLTTTEPPPTTLAPTMGTSPPVTNNTPLTTNTDTPLIPSTRPSITQSTTDLDLIEESTLVSTEVHRSTTIHVTDTKSSNTTKIVIPTQVTDDYSFSSGVTAAVTVGVLVIVGITMMVVVVIVIVVLVMKRHKMNNDITLNHQRGEQMIDVKLNEAYGTRNEVTRDTTTEAVYDVIDETGQKEPEEPIPTDTNAAYHSHSVNNTTTEAPEYYDVLANPYEAVPVGEVDMPMEENTAYASNAVDNDQETTDYDYVLRQ